MQPCGLRVLREALYGLEPLIGARREGPSRLSSSSWRPCAIEARLRLYFLPATLGTPQRADTTNGYQECAICRRSASRGPRGRRAHVTCLEPDR